MGKLIGRLGALCGRKLLVPGRVAAWQEWTALSDLWARVLPCLPLIEMLHDLSWYTHSKRTKSGKWMHTKCLQLVVIQRTPCRNLTISRKTWPCTHCEMACHSQHTRLLTTCAARSRIICVDACLPSICCWSATMRASALHYTLLIILRPCSSWTRPRWVTPAFSSTVPWMRTGSRASLRLKVLSCWRCASLRFRSAS